MRIYSILQIIIAHSLAIALATSAICEVKAKLSCYEEMNVWVAELTEFGWFHCNTKATTNRLFFLHFLVSTTAVMLGTGTIVGTSFARVSIRLLVQHFTFLGCVIVDEAAFMIFVRFGSLFLQLGPIFARFFAWSKRVFYAHKSLKLAS